MSKPKYPSDKLNQFMIRLPAGMRDEIKDAAAANNRTMNAEIVARLSSGSKTLRDEFAMAALPSLLTGNWQIQDTAAEGAYRAADAMLAAREAKP